MYPYGFETYKGLSVQRGLKGQGVLGEHDRGQMRHRTLLESSHLMITTMIEKYERWEKTQRELEYTGFTCTNG